MELELKTWFGAWVHGYISSWCESQRNEFEMVVIALHCTTSAPTKLLKRALELLRKVVS